MGDAERFAATVDLTYADPHYRLWQAFDGLLVLDLKPASQRLQLAPKWYGR